MYSFMPLNRASPEPIHTHRQRPEVAGVTETITQDASGTAVALTPEAVAARVPDAVETLQVPRFQLASTCADRGSLLAYRPSNVARQLLRVPIRDVANRLVPTTPPHRGGGGSWAVWMQDHRSSKTTSAHQHRRTQSPPATAPMMIAFWPHADDDGNGHDLAKLYC